MPSLWADTIDSHRRQVHGAILDATATLIIEKGPLSVAMSAIADRAGIGRATLYKYFPDVESILVAWHSREFAAQLDRLKALCEDDRVTLEDIGEFVSTQRRCHSRHRGADTLGAIAHTLAGEHVLEGAVEPQIVAVLTSVLRGLADRKAVRDDQDSKLLARWLLHAVHAPGDLDDDAVAQLVVDSLAPTPTRRRRRQPPSLDYP